MPGEHCRLFSAIAGGTDRSLHGLDPDYAEEIRSAAG